MILLPGVLGNRVPFCHHAISMIRFIRCKSIVLGNCRLNSPSQIYIAISDTSVLSSITMRHDHITCKKNAIKSHHFWGGRE